MSHLGVLGVHLDWQRLTYQKFVAKTKENHNQNEIIASSPSSADLIFHRCHPARTEIESDENQDKKMTKFHYVLNLWELSNILM